VLDHWALVEADFQREYGLDLSRALWSMTWRRFSTLLAGLSPEAVFIHRMAKDGKRARSSGPVLSDPKEIAEAIKARFRGKR